MQIPSGKVGVDKSRVEIAGRESVEKLFARFETGDLVIALGNGDSACHNSNPLTSKVGQRAYFTRVAPDHQSKLGARIGNAPGDPARDQNLVVGRSRRRSAPQGGNATRNPHSHTNGTRQPAQADVRPLGQRPRRCLAVCHPPLDRCAALTRVSHRPSEPWLENGRRHRHHPPRAAHGNTGAQRDAREQCGSEPSADWNRQLHRSLSTCGS